MLLGTKQGELSQTLVGLVAEQRHTTQNIFAIRRQLVQRVGTREHSPGAVVVVFPNEIA